MFPSKIKFTAFGHENILSTHKNTLEFTKDEKLTLDGDCIVGVKSDFSLNQIKEFIKNVCSDSEGNVEMVICAGGRKVNITAKLNPDFNDEQEIVLRKTDFLSGRTLATRATKSALDLDREFVDLLKNPQTKINVEIKCKKDN